MTKPIGLPNKGNSCFVNSVLQCLYTVFDSFESPTLSLSRALRWRKEFFGDAYSQEDAHEFLLYTLDKLHRRNTRRVSLRFHTRSLTPNQLAWKEYAEKDYSFVIGLFHGQYIVHNTCDSCHKTYTSYEPFMGLELALPQNTQAQVQVQDLLKDHSRPETISGYKCERPTCKASRRERTVTQYRKINRYPQCLTICLKRFHGGRRPVKNNALVGISKRIQFYNRTYRLVGICNHIGSLNGGHYTANVLSGDGKWYNCDDERISRQSQFAIQNAYILFYIKD